MRQKIATISDVAKQAGVSKAAVSKYLNKMPYVSARSAQKIEQAIEQLSYQPNSVARALSNRSTHLIGLVIGAFDNPLNAELSKSIETTAASYGYNIVMMSTNDMQGTGRLRTLDLLSGRQGYFDGVLLASLRADDLEQIIPIKSICSSVVAVHRYLPGMAADYAVVDSYKGGEIAAKHLLGCGHKRIAIVNGPQSIFPFYDRGKGFVDTLAHAQIELTETVGDCYSLEDGCHAGKLLLQKGEVTAIFCGSDMLALGVLEAARELKIRVPEEVSVMGFDNTRFAALAHVSLTTIHGRLKDLGVEAVKMLVERMEHADSTFYCQKVLEPILVERESVGPPARL